MSLKKQTIVSSKLAQRRVTWNSFSHAPAKKVKEAHHRRLWGYGVWNYESHGVKSPTSVSSSLLDLRNDWFKNGGENYLELYLRKTSYICVIG